MYRFAILLFIPFSLFAQQDKLVLRFDEEAKLLSKEQQTKLNFLLRSRKVDKLFIRAYIGSKKSVSSNRINVEYRVNHLKELCQRNGLYFNQIYLERTVTSDSLQFNRIVLRIAFAPNKEDSTIFKTDILEISKNGDRSKPKIEPRVEHKPRKAFNRYKYLDVYEFKEGSKFILNNVNFEGGRHKITVESWAVLDDLVKVLKDRPTMIIELHGHICCITTGRDAMDLDTHTRNLSIMRAKAVYDFLVDQGISKERLSYKGFGSRFKLIKDDGDEWSAKRNRRVEVLIRRE